MLDMASEERRESIFEAAKAIVVEESPLGKKMQFLEYSVPHIRVVDELVSEFESRYKVERIVGEKVFGPDGVTPVWIHDMTRSAAPSCIYGSFGYYDHLAVGQCWKINLGDKWFIQINLFIYSSSYFANLPDFVVEMGQEEAGGSWPSDHKGFHESAPGVHWSREGRHSTKRLSLVGGGYKYIDRGHSLELLLARAYAKYMNLNNLIEVKIQDVKVRKANENGRAATTESKVRVVPDHLIKYEVIGGKEEEIETNCPKCNGDYGGKFAQMCPYCGVSRRIFYVRRGEEVR